VADYVIYATLHGSYLSSRSVVGSKLEVVEDVTPRYESTYNVRSRAGQIDYWGSVDALLDQQIKTRFPGVRRGSKQYKALVVDNRAKAEAIYANAVAKADKERQWTLDRMKRQRLERAEAAIGYLGYLRSRLDVARLLQPLSVVSEKSLDEFSTFLDEQEARVNALVASADSDYALYPHKEAGNGEVSPADPGHQPSAH
jgi:hypothetical protein